jgi:uncharacterized protein
VSDRLGAPDPIASRALAATAVGFAHELRSRGLVVPISAVTTYREALGVVAGVGRPALYWAGRSLFVHGPDDVGPYDTAFGAFFLGQEHHRAPTPVIEATPDTAEDRDEGDAADSESPSDEDDALPPGGSAQERLGSKDFATLSTAELAVTHKLMEAIAFEIPHRRSRRRSH